MHCDPRTSVNMALRAVRSVRAAVRSLRVAAAPAATCLPRPWGLRAGPVRTLRTGSALLSGKRGRARGESRAAWGDGAGLLPPGSLPTSSPQRTTRQRGDPCPRFFLLLGSLVAWPPPQPLSCGLGTQEEEAWSTREATKCGLVPSGRIAGRSLLENRASVAKLLRDLRLSRVCVHRGP